VVVVDEATGRDRATIGSGDGCFHCSNETGSVQWKPKLAPAVSGVFGGSGSSPNNFEDGIAYVGAVGVSRGDLGADRRGDFALRPL
jgi:hypothetical protein